MNHFVKKPQRNGIKNPSELFIEQKPRRKEDVCNPNYASNEIFDANRIIFGRKKIRNDSTKHNLFVANKFF